LQILDLAPNLVLPPLANKHPPFFDVDRDGTVAYRCAFDFMDSEAGFDISDTMLDFTNTDSYWYAFYLGFLNTLRVGLLGVILTSFVGTFAGIARLSNNWLIARLALWYVELIRNTPLLVQLFFLYFGIILALPDIGDAIQPFGLPIFLSNRGLDLPWPTLTASASVWLAFLVLAIIQLQVLWIYLARRDERTGKTTNPLWWSIASFLIVVGIGWSVSSAVADNEGLMVTKASRIREISDLEQMMLSRYGINHFDELDALDEEVVTEGQFKLCVLRDSSSEPNFTRQLRSMDIPYSVRRTARPDQAIGAYTDEKCEAFAAPTSILAAERGALEKPGSHVIISVPESPIVWDVPAFERLNTAGGVKLSPEFTALLLGLVIFYGGTLAEVVRAGILSVSKGQTEAARALGLGEGQRLQLVVLPQALRVVIPPLIGIYLSLIKDTSLGIAIGFPDMYAVASTTINQSGRAVQMVLLIMVVYLIISMIFSMILNWYNDRVVFVER
ncbi:MAG: ABC transporter permease subunit, partial [Chloroflexota bacterium]